MHVASSLGDAGLIDPQGIVGVEPVAPARRPPSLKGRRVLLLDNKKLGRDYGPYAVLWDALQEQLPGTEWAFWVGDLSKYVETEIQPLAARIVEEQPFDAVVLALGDAGVSQNTALLALELERRGKPAVILATLMGARFIRGLFAALAPAFDPIALDTVRTDTPETIRRLVAEQLDAIVSRLTAGPPSGAAAAAAPAGPSLGARDWTAIGDGMQEFAEWAERADFGDGLPLIPPTEHAVQALLAHAAADPETVLFGPAVTSGRMLRVRDAAANAAMTGCPPRAFPVVVAALRAMALPGYRLNWAAITTHPSGNAIVFSGPNAARFGLSGGPGCLGPGFRANACVGRAVNLCVLSLFGARPGAVDLTTFGSPAEFTYCLAEAVDESPWPSLADELGGGKPGVFVSKSEGPRNVLEHQTLTPEGLIEAFAGTATGVGSNNAYIPGDLLVFVNPEHARIFSDAGWTRTDVAYAIYEHARIPVAKIKGHGIRPDRPAFASTLDEVPVVRSVSDVRVVVAGAPAPQSLVALPWGFSRGQWHPI